MNQWLNSVVKTYVDQWGESDHPVVYEVGSRDGKDGEEMAKRIYSGVNLWRDATVVLCECNPPQIEAIQRDYPRAILIQEAISNKKGKTSFIQLHGDHNVVGSSSMDLNRSRQPWAKKNTVIEVPTRRLDDVILELGHEKKQIDIMKIDIEGYTFEALESLGKYLRNVRVFHLEAEIEGVARAETNLDIFKYMEDHGYRCTALENEWGVNIQDQVWIRKSEGK